MSAKEELQEGKSRFICEQADQNKPSFIQEILNCRCIHESFIILFRFQAW